YILTQIVLEGLDCRVSIFNNRIYLFVNYCLGMGVCNIFKSLFNFWFTKLLCNSFVNMKFELFLGSFLGFPQVLLYLLFPSRQTIGRNIDYYSHKNTKAISGKDITMLE